MTAASIINTTTPLIDAIGVCETFGAQFGAPFQPWRRYDGQWVCIDDARPAPRELQEHLDAAIASETGRPHVAIVDGSQRFVSVRFVDEGGGDIVVAGLVTTAADRLVANLAQAALDRHAVESHDVDQRELIDSFANRLADSFEELTFLRRLASHIEYCDAAHSLIDVARAVLPSLRNLLRIEGLALVLAADDASGAVRADHIALSDGTLRGAADDWLRIVGAIRGGTRDVVVKNFGPLVDRGTDPRPLAGVRSVVILPLAKDGTTFGWLLGVNKRPSANATAPQANSLAFDEIGTMEATLLQSAAVLLATHAANVRLFQEKEQLIVDAIHTLVGVIEAKDAYTCGHSDRVALVARHIARRLELPEDECQNVYLAGLLHDIGKVGVADDVLLKPGDLADEEFALIRRHPEIGWRLLQRLKPLQKLLPGVLHHHEALDGTGYPQGLAGDDVPLMARILAVADAWDAMTSDRPYRRGLPKAKAVQILVAGAGRQWDRRVVDAFLTSIATIEATVQDWRDDLLSILNPPWECDGTAAAATPRKPVAAAVEPDPVGAGI